MPGGVDRSGEPPHDGLMADEITRHELDAKLELIETRMDGRVLQIENQVAKSIESTERAIDVVRETMSTLQDENKQTRSSISAAKWWAIGTGVAVLLGVWQIVTGVNQGIIAAFESGRATGKAQSPSSTNGELSPPPSAAKP
jgi:hypothetical protein